MAISITGFNASATGTVVKATTLTASDTSGTVAGYGITTSATPPLASESASAYAARVGGGATFTGWLASAPTSWTAAGAGTYSLWAHAKDAAGNITTTGPVSVTLS